MRRNQRYEESVVSGTLTVFSIPVEQPIDFYVSTRDQGVGKQAKNDGTSATLTKSDGAKPALRPELQQAVDDSLEDYEYLKQFARKP